MSAYYLIDAHTNPILSSEINDVVDSRTDILSSGNPAVIVNGNIVVRVADDQPVVRDPQSLSDLLIQKYNGLKARYNLANVVYDPLLDASQVNAPNNNVKLGERGGVGVSYAGNLRTTAQVLTYAPTVVVVLVEFFRWHYLNPKDGRLLRVYEEVPLSEQPGVSVSVDGGTSFTPVSGNTATIPLAETGTSLVLNIGASPTYNDNIMIGSWAALY